MYYGTSDSGAVSLEQTISNNYRIDYSTGSDFNKLDFGSLYKWNIIPTSSITVNGLDSSDNISSLNNNYTLSRDVNGTDNNTLKITSGEKVINVTNFDFNQAPEQIILSFPAV